MSLPRRSVSEKSHSIFLLIWPSRLSSFSHFDEGAASDTSKIAQSRSTCTRMKVISRRVYARPSLGILVLRDRPLSQRSGRSPLFYLGWRSVFYRHFFGLLARGVRCPPPCLRISSPVSRFRLGIGVDRGGKPLLGTAWCQFCAYRYGTMGSFVPLEWVSSAHGLLCGPPNDAVTYESDVDGTELCSSDSCCSVSEKSATCELALPREQTMVLASGSGMNNT